VFDWLFKKKKIKTPPRKLYPHDDLAAEFFAMSRSDQSCVLRNLGVSGIHSTLAYAKPCDKVIALATWIRDNQFPMYPLRFLKELHNYLDADKRISVLAVFQQIFRDQIEAETYVIAMEKLHKNHSY